MNKIKLDLDSLQIESFETTPDESGAKGTVHGLVGSGEPEFCTDFTICIQICPQPTIGTACPSFGSTCGNTCGGTCGSTCGSTCGNTCGGTCAVTCSFTCGITCGTAGCEPTCNNCRHGECP